MPFQNRLVIFKVFILTNLSSFFCQKTDFGGNFLPDKPSVYPIPFTVFPLLELKNIASRSELLINISCFISCVCFFLQLSPYQIMCLIFGFSFTDSVVTRKFFHACSCFHVSLLLSLLFSLCLLPEL